MSLVCNAARISRNGERVILAEIDTGAKQLQLMIKGCGAFSQDSDKKKIFENLVHRSTGCLQQSNELGIGLYLTKQLIELHYGSIDLIGDQSGDSFHVIMPLGAGD